MLIFGEPWDAPICDDATPYPEVPTYAACIYCGEQFEDGDRGVIMPHLGAVDPRYLIGVAGADRDPAAAAHFAVGTLTYSLVGEHRECLLSSTAGHVVGACSCTGWETHTRATALEVQRRVDAGALRRP